MQRVMLFLRMGAAVLASAACGATPSRPLAADDLNRETVGRLLAQDATRRVEGPAGITPLTQAVSGGALTDLTDRPLLGGCRPATVRALLDHDPTLRIPETFAGRQALWWA